MTRLRKRQSKEFRLLNPLSRALHLTSLPPLSPMLTVCRHSGIKTVGIFDDADRYIETTPSTVSTFPESSQHNATQPDYDPSSSTIAVGSEGSPASGLPKGQHLGAPNVPKRSSSRSKLSPDTISSMPDTSVQNSNNIDKRGSKSSLKQGSRSASVASKNSKQGGAAGLPERGVETKPKRRKGFLSILNCCQPSENANEVELAEQEVPAKRTKIKQNPGRQSTPGLKSGEGKKTAEDNIGGPEYSELRPAAKPKMVTRPSKDKVSPDKPAQSSSSTSDEVPDQPQATHDPPLPPLPTSSSTEEGKRDSKALATASEPPQMLKPEDSVAVQGTVINDRTVQQEAQDSDVAMPDAPPITSKDTPQDTAQELAQAQMNLPPPPPRNGERSVSRETNSNEKQLWLLPPLQPSLKGKKCLVLDLDETLVHSSFKVGMSYGFWALLMIADVASSGFYDTCGDRGPIT